MSRYQINVIRTGHDLVDCICMTDRFDEYLAARHFAGLSFDDGLYTEVNFFTPGGGEIRRQGKKPDFWTYDDDADEEED